MFSNSDIPFSLTMKTYLSMFALPALLLLVLPVGSSTTDPISKVVAMISKLQQDVIHQGEQEQTMYNKLSTMCSDRSRQLHQEIKTGKARVAELTATIEKATADLAVLQEKIGDAADQTSDADSELQKATMLRKKEAMSFEADEQELKTIIGSIERAMVTIERDGHGASLAQMDRMQSVTQVLQTMVDASTVESSSASTLVGLLQASRDASDRASADSDEDETGAPSAATYAGQTGNVVETLEALLDKSKTQLDEGRQAETNNVNAYQMLKQSLEAKLKTLAKAMDDTKKTSAETQEKKASAEGDLEATTKDVDEDVKDLKELHHACLDKATSFEESTSSRDEMLKALAKAKNAIVGSTQGAAKQRYSMVQTSFLQVRVKDTTSVASDALHVVRRLAFDLHSQSLIDLRNRMSTVIRSSSLAGTSPFDKVKEMLNSMISKLEAEADSETAKKAYCDKELGESGGSKEDKEDTIDMLAVKVDGMAAASKKLKGEVFQLEKDVAALARTQAEMDQLRAEERGNYDKNRPVMEQGLEGVKTALKELRNYYAKDDDSTGSDGAANGIIGLLEVVESDFSKSLAVLISAEEAAESTYQAETKENSVLRATKEQDVKYKTAEHVSLDKSTSELNSDKAGVGDELAAVDQYLVSMKKECIAKPDSYEDRKKRREEQVAGLREALETLNGDSVLLQVSASHRTLRGSGRLEAAV